MVRRNLLFKKRRQLLALVLCSATCMQAVSADDGEVLLAPPISIEPSFRVTAVQEPAPPTLPPVEVRPPQQNSPQPLQDQDPVSPSDITPIPDATSNSNATGTHDPRE